MRLQWTQPERETIEMFSKSNAQRRYSKIGFGCRVPQIMEFCHHRCEVCELYTTIPLGHPQYSQHRTHILKVNKNLYGTRECPMLWFNALSRNLFRNFRLNTSKYDPCIFYNKDLMVLTYVDKFLVLGFSETIKSFVSKLSKSYEITSTGLNKDCDFLGLQIQRIPRHPFLLQHRPYVKNLFQRFGRLTEVATRRTPLPVDIARATFK